MAIVEVFRIARNVSTIEETPKDFRNARRLARIISRHNCYKAIAKDGNEWAEYEQGECKSATDQKFLD